MNTTIYLAQLAQVGEALNQVLRREGISQIEENLNAKIKRTYPKEG